MATTLDELKKLLHKYSKNKPALESATAATRLRKDLGVSSVNLVDVVLDIEEGFGITIDDDELADMSTLGEALALIDKKRGAAK